MLTRFTPTCWLLFILVLSLTPTLLPAQTKELERNPAQFDAFIDQLMKRDSIPGLSIAIIRQNKLVYHKGYGLTRSDSTQKVTSETIFEAASLTKPTFAYAVLQLVDQGLLDLDKPLCEYLPYSDVATDERYKKITARLVLSHRSGLPNWRKNRRSSELAMLRTPGERFGYSGEGFVYLQKVVEKITGKPINEFMEERVLNPLGMTNSGYVWKPTFDSHVALPHYEGDNVGEKYKPDQANMAYSLQTSANDYAKFILAILTPKGLKASTVDQILSQQTQLPTRFSGDSLSTRLYWGLGFGLERTPNDTYFWHWGDNGAFKCYLVGSRSRKDAVVYFTNSATGLRLISDITKQVMGYDPATSGFLGYQTPRKP
ncbi:serine hydrolase domain-containing protein [Spirosoma aerolatum]|uniref:serine hydrolase domain-containing protein n=1 Tax=Spirosoma aerolatum TaxID=1211326 RepID=UPI0009ADCD2C|nr:serine hydrolase domain-containing protein [Spirosoma aerolatum]